MSNYEIAAQHYKDFCKREINGNAYEEWQEYREELTSFIIKNAKRRKTIAIYGAGECNDIDLVRLSNHFSKVILVDFADLAVKKGINKQGVESRDNFIYVHKDLLGMEDEVFIKYFELFLDNMKLMRTGRDGVQKVQEKIIEYIKEAYAKNRTYTISTDDIIADYAVMAGLHSQINSRFIEIWELFLEALYSIDVNLYKAVLPFSVVLANEVNLNTSYVIKRLNDCIFISTKEGVMFACEESVTGKYGYGINGASHCIVDIDKRCESSMATIKDGFSTLWDLDVRRNLTYQMKVCYVKKIKKGILSFLSRFSKNRV